MQRKQYYDVIGDIHGHAGALRRLLAKLGYAEIEGVFRHESRKVIFAGDFADRGPHQKETIAIARGMCEAGAARAVLGNHEFNAIAWSIRKQRRGFLRKHTPKNRKQHEKFLKQLAEGSPAYRKAIQWFRRLPLWLELPGGLRVVHACWHKPSMNVLAEHINDEGAFTEQGLREACSDGTGAHAAAEVVLKGPEQTLPNKMSFFDKDGHAQRRVRLRWWEPKATTFRRAAIGMDEQLEKLPETELPTDFRYLETIPVLFGHYWMQGKPMITNPKAACLDFSVANNGCLTAYRWSGERELVAENLAHVPADA